MHSDPNLPGFMKIQLQFAAHIRDPEKPSPGDVDDRRMAIYRELFFNNIEDFMSNSYPVMKEVLGESRWLALIREYYALHGAKNPLFPPMPVELLNFLEKKRESAGDPPFLYELAHYEWSELALALSADAIDITGVDPNTSLVENRPVLSPLVLPLCYQFPVHKICADFQPHSPEAPVCLVIYRDRMDKVRFMETNLVTLKLVEMLIERPEWTGSAVLDKLAVDEGKESIRTHGEQALEDLKSRGVILGARK